MKAVMGGCAVFLFAHQDDEFAVFPQIEAELAAGRRAICIYLTDGAFGGQSAVVRNAESLAVLTAMGVDATDAVFLGEPAGIRDGCLYESLELALQKSLEVVRGMDITAFYVMAWEGGHQDHDAGHLVGLALAVRLGLLEKTWQFSLYNGRGLPWLFFRVLSPLSGNGPVLTQRLSWAKRWQYVRHCLSYKSQRKAWLGLFPFVAAHYLLGGQSQWQPVSLGRIANRPHAGPLLYEKRAMCDYLTFRQFAQSFITQCIVGAKPENG
jgi:LmbE family N-acetylglucosaminyl deacetylase